MERLTEELTLDQIDDFFTIGKTPKVHSLPKSRTGGRPLDPVTGKPVVSQPTPQFIPPYKRCVVPNSAYMGGHKDKRTRR